jgi:hypothetical protein
VVKLDCHLGWTCFCRATPGPIGKRFTSCFQSSAIAITAACCRIPAFTYQFATERQPARATLSMTQKRPTDRTRSEMTVGKDGRRTLTP